MSKVQQAQVPKILTDRRAFLKFFFSLVSTVIGVFTPIVGFLVPPKAGPGGGGGRVLAGTTTEIPVGQAKVVPLGNKPVIVTNTPQGVKAFSGICTHLGCINIWDESRNVILCPCHDGLFSPLTGAVVGGPPPKGLAEIPVTLDGEDIYIGEA